MRQRTGNPDALTLLNFRLVPEVKRKLPFIIIMIASLRVISALFPRRNKALLYSVVPLDVERYSLCSTEDCRHNQTFVKLST